MYVLIILVQFQYFDFFFNITHVVILCFGFEGWIKILIATVPGIYILFAVPRRQRSANAVKAQCERGDSTVHAM